MNILALLLLSVPAHADMTVLRAAAPSVQAQASAFDGSLWIDGASAPAVKAGVPDTRETPLSASRVERRAKVAVPAHDDEEGTLEKGEGWKFLLEIVAGAVLIGAGVALTVTAAPVGAMILGLGLKVLGIFALAKAFNRLDN